MTDVAELEAQHARLVLPSFTADDAWRLGNLLVDTARHRALPIVIDIHRGRQQLFHCALEGASANNDVWADRKRRVVEYYGVSSYLVGARFRAKGTTFEQASRLDPHRFAAHGGSVPITVRQVGVVGALTVSGLAQEDDHALAVECLEQFLAVVGA